jgi:tRNA modification GTPase
MNHDTIAAISTPAGSGALAVVRLSGPLSYPITEGIFETSGGKSLQFKAGSRGMQHGWIIDGNRRIDEVMVARYAAPATYTGEDLVEISCHGSVYIQQEILRLLIDRGARLARPGEFTQRAFLNGKLDLAQAEAVADLIASSGAASHRLAVDQIRGGFSNELATIRLQLLNFVSLIELELDFSEEDVEFADRSLLRDLIGSITERITGLISSFELGNAIKTGVPVAIAGETNVGKSTLLNALLKEEKAIVSEIAGTTRDSIEDCIHLAGIEFRFIDTAGLRNTTDEIETIGIGRSYRQIEKARIILLVTDATADPGAAGGWVTDIISRIREDQQVLLLVNKSDMDPLKARSFGQIINEKAGLKTRAILISARQGTGIRELEEELLRLVNFRSVEDSGVVVTNIRHYEALSRTQTALYRAANGLNMGISGDFLSQDIREAMHYLGEITGEISTDEVLGNIFRHFCIGK